MQRNRAEAPAPSGSPLERLLALLDGVVEDGEETLALCPAHADTCPSLALTEGDDGRALLICRAGCATKDVLAALGLEYTDLFAAEAVYRYHDADGELLFEEVRRPGAKARFRRPAGRGGYTWNLQGVPRVLYRLPELLAAPPETLIWLAEGPKDVETLRGWGLVATCNPMGAGSWRAEYTETLAGRHVRFLADNDPAGLRHRATVASELLAVVASLKQVDLPGVGPGEDVTDWAARGGSPALLLVTEELTSLTSLTSLGDISAPVPFPLDVFPPPVRRYIEEGARSLHCPPDLIAVPLLGFTGAALGRQAVIEIKRGFTERAVLWLATVAKPGAAKSPATNLARRPLDEQQRKARQAHADAVRAWQAEKQHWEHTPKTERGLEPERPIMPSYYSTDYTWEALCTLLERTPGLAIAQDELLAWIRTCDMYRGGRGADRSRWLSAWSGAPIHIHRKGSVDSIYLDGYVLPVVGNIQPDLLNDLADEAGRRDGLVERILYSMPETWASRFTDYEMAPETAAPVLALFEQLYTTSSEDERPVQLSDAARERFKEWANENADRTDEAHGVLAGIYAKLPVQLARLTLTLHGLWCPGALTARRVSVERVEQAIVLVEYFREHAERVVPAFGEASVPRPRRLIDRLLQALQRARGAWVARESLWEAVGRRGTATALTAALEELTAAGQAERRRLERPGRPREEWRWHTTPREVRGADPAGAGLESPVSETDPSEVREASEVSPETPHEKPRPPTTGRTSEHRIPRPATNGHGTATETTGAVPVVTAEQHGFTYITSDAELAAILPALLAAESLALDTETAVPEGETWTRKHPAPLTPHLARLSLLQLATADATYVIDALTCDVRALAPVFAREVELIAHNARFDLAVLAAHGLPARSARVYDTYTASRLAESQKGLAHGLKAVVPRLLGEPMDKAEQLSDWSRRPLSLEHLTYAARDARVLFPLRQRLDARLEEAQLTACWELERALLPCLLAMEQHGMLVDVPRWQELAAEMAATRDQIATEVQAALGADFALTKRAELGNALSRLGVELPLSPSGQVQTNKKALQRALNAHEVVPKILAWAKARTLSQNFGAKFLERVAPDGRLHASFRQIGTVTGRMSCGAPNLQQVPKDPRYRACFRAPEGHLLIQVDLSNIQMACAAEVAGDERLIAALSAGAKVHRITAAAIFGVPEAEVTDWQYAFGKTVNFGILFGEGEQGLIESGLDHGLLLDSARAQEIFRRFATAWPELDAWRRRQMAQRRRQIRAPLGLGRVRWLGEGERGTVNANTPIQQVEADAVKCALRVLWESRAEHPTARLVNVIHDELIVEETAEAASETAAWVLDCLQTGVGQVLRRVQTHAEVKIGPNWATG
jgi:DNA polymerase I